MAHNAAHNAAPNPNPSAEPPMEAPKAAAAPKRLPKVILLDDDIGWHQNGVLRKFAANQVIANREDIAALIEKGATYREVQ